MNTEKKVLSLVLNNWRKTKREFEAEEIDIRHVKNILLTNICPLCHFYFDARTGCTPCPIKRMLGVQCVDHPLWKLFVSNLDECILDGRIGRKYILVPWGKIIRVITKLYNRV